MLNVVRGDSKKPVASESLAKYFEGVKNKYEGTLYIGYPIIGTMEGGYEIDALLITKEKDIIVFNIIEGTSNNDDYKDIQDENYSKVQAKFLLNKKLLKKRELALKITTATYAPKCPLSLDDLEEGYYYLSTDNDIDSFLENELTNNSGDNYYHQALSTLQSITRIRNTKSRAYVKNQSSKGAELKRLEDSIANLDRSQSEAIIESVEGVQRIRGLAGSGKTIVLALKVAYLHSKNPNWKIAVTFNTRSLKGQLTNYIKQFCYEAMSQEPNWGNIEIIHAWGSIKSRGIYYNLCEEHGIEFLDFSDSRRLSKEVGREFDFVCEKALKEISNFQKKYDLIVVDEAQDFSKDFLKICFNITRKPKRVVYAYDELQSLNKKSMDAPEKIFGTNIQLNKEKGKPKGDIILHTCYRNSLEVLSTAHALGFGIYNKNGLVQMFDDSSLWREIGYKIVDGSLEEGKDVSLRRDSETSPEFLSKHSNVDEILEFKEFKNNDEQVDYIVAEIYKNINEDELKASDIMIINPNPLTTKEVAGKFREKLFQKGIDSSLAGISSSPDVFFQENQVIFTGIYRAKGNEAAMVYIINSEYCYDGWELARKRNILFTAITRSKAWVRVCGVGHDMKLLKKEFETIKNNNFILSFKYPTVEERKSINIVNRDMSTKEIKKVKENREAVGNLIKDLQSGAIKKEDVSGILLDLMKEVSKE